MRRRVDGVAYAKTESLTVSQALSRLTAEIHRLEGVSRLVISTNIEVRRDGLPYSGQADPKDPGVAVYFTRSKKPYCLACDRWDRVADNLAAVAAHVGALRGIERWGCGTIEQAFTGHLALAYYGVDWRVVFAGAKTFDDVERMYAERARRAHPDHGGSHEDMRQLNEARDKARAELAA